MKGIILSAIFAIAVIANVCVQDNLMNDVLSTLSMSPSSIYSYP